MGKSRRQVLVILYFYRFNFSSGVSKEKKTSQQNVTKVKKKSYELGQHVKKKIYNDYHRSINE